MSAPLYLLLASEIPDFGDDSEQLIVDKGLDATRPIDPKHLSFVSTAVAAREHSDGLSLAISQWLAELGVSGVELELLATHPRGMSPDQRERLALLDPGAWSINTSFVAFARHSPEARDEARRLVLASALYQS